MKILLARWGNKAIEFLILGAVLIVTLLFGGVQRWGFAAAFGLLALACCLWAALRLWVPRPQRGARAARNTHRDSDWVVPLRRGTRLVWVLLPLCAAYLILQQLPLPAGLVRVLSPHRALLASRAQEALGLEPPRWLTLSIQPESTRLALGQFALALLAFWAGLYAGAHRRRARRIVRGLLLLVLLEAAYGLAENLTFHNYVLWVPGLDATARGTFINHNHYAALLALFAPLAIGWFLYRAAEPVFLQRFNAYRPAGLEDIFTSRRGMWLLAPVILLLGILQSTSRGGFSSVILGVALFFAFSLRGRLGRTLSWLAVLLGMALIVYGLNSEYEKVIGYLGSMTQAQHTEIRWVTWRDSMKMLRDFPLCGVGLGNFGLAFKPYSSLDTMYYSEQAHNEWLEALLTLGWLGWPLLLLLVLGLARAIVRNVRRGGSDKLWLLGGACGLAGLALHCVVDFNFHIPAICLTASLLLGILAGYQPRRASHHGG